MTDARLEAVLHTIVLLAILGVFTITRDAEVLALLMTGQALGGVASAIARPRQ